MSVSVIFCEILACLKIKYGQVTIVSCGVNVLLVIHNCIIKINNEPIYIYRDALGRQIFNLIKEQICQFLRMIKHPVILLFPDNSHTSKPN